MNPTFSLQNHNELNFSSLLSSPFDCIIETLLVSKLQAEKALTKSRIGNRLI
jgi:hypothetical protein